MGSANHRDLRVAHVYTDTGCEIATLCGTKIELDEKVYLFLKGWDTSPGMRIEFDDYDGHKKTDA